MTSTPWVNVKNTKAFAKLLGKRFGMKLSRAQQMVCSACGYRGGFGEIYNRAESVEMLEGLELSDYAAWRTSLGFELGSDMEVLLKEDELDAWFRRIHGIPTLGLTEEADDGD